MRKLLLLLPLLLIAGCSNPKLTCTVEKDTAPPSWGKESGWKVELEVDSEAKPGKPGYGRVYRYEGSSFENAELSHVMGGQIAAKLLNDDDRILYLDCN